MKKVVRKLVMILLLFAIVLAVGYLGWDLTKGQRSELENQYLAKAEELERGGDSRAMWELEKAYWLGMDYQDYRRQRAIKLTKFDMDKGEEELKLVLDKGWGDNRVYYEYAKISLEKKEYIKAEEYFLKISDYSDANGKKAVEYLVFLAGIRGDWITAREYFDLLGDNANNSNSLTKMDLSLYLLDNDLESAKLVYSQGDWSEYEKKIIEERLVLLSDMGNEIYYLTVADLLIDLDLGEWSIEICDQLPPGMLGARHVLLVYAKSYLHEKDCQKSWEYANEALKLDSTEKPTHELLVEIYKCLGDREWENWEKGIVNSL